MTDPDYRERARVDLDEALFRSHNQAGPLAVLVPAALSIAGSLAALVDVLRDAPVAVPVGVPCSCGMARLVDNGRKRLTGGVLHRADGPCYRSTPGDVVPEQGGPA